MGVTDILCELIVDSAMISIVEENGHYICHLTEPKSDYKLTLRHLPKDALIINCDKFPNTGKVFFRGDNMECKRADYALISESANIIMFFELKRSRSTGSTRECVAQLKGAECVMDYCRIIAASFFGSPDIFYGLRRRYYIVHYKTPTKRTFESQQKEGGHTPEVPRKIGSGFASFDWLM